MKLYSVLFILAASASVTGAAAAQSPLRTIDLGAVPRSSVQSREGMVRVQSSISLFLPGPTGTQEDAEKLRERARQMIYTTASHECELLKQTLAADCRLESVNSNVNGNRQYGPGQQEGINVTGSMTFRITPK